MCVLLVSVVLALLQVFVLVLVLLLTR